MKFENNFSNLEKLDDIEKRIKFTIMTFYNKKGNATLLGYYKFLEQLLKLIDYYHPEKIKERKKQKKAYRLGISIEDLNDPEKVLLAENKLREIRARRREELARRESEKLRSQTQRVTNETEDTSSSSNFQTKSEDLPSEVEQSFEPDNSKRKSIFGKLFGTSSYTPSEDSYDSETKAIPDMFV